MKAVFALLFVLAVANASSVPSLTNDNFESSIAGKNAFVKFFAPWCGHCKRMAADWENLATAYSGSSSLVIAEVDCTVENDLCGKHGVQGYPTIKYWTDGQVHDYSGGRDYEALDKFVKDTLHSPCLVEDPKDCTEKEVSFIKQMKEAGAEVIKKQLERLQGMSSTKAAANLKQWLNQRLNILKQLAEKQEL